MPPQEHSPITPWPIPGDVRAVILVGGTFDPPHTGHTALAAAARESCAPDSWLVFVPAGRSPFKAESDATPGSHRAAMLRLAVRGLPRASVWTDELDRAEHSPSFTVETVRRMLTIAPKVTARLLIGTDQALQFHRWHQAPTLLTLVTPLVLPRGDTPDATTFAAALRRVGVWSDDDIGRWTSWCAPSPRVHPASSTAIRTTIATSPRGVDDVHQGWLSPEVTAYIRSHGLYRR